MDYDDNLVTNYAARQARIRQIQDLLTNVVVGEDPPDDGIAEPGMVLTVRYDDTGEIETFPSVRRARRRRRRRRRVLDAITAGQRDRRRARWRTTHLLHPQRGQAARDAPHGGALRYARAETTAATVGLAATQRTLGDPGLTTIAVDTTKHTPTPASRPRRHLERRTR